MTPLPKRRWSTRRQGKKRATLSIGTATTTKCSHCQTEIVNHTACPSCGFYAGKPIVKPKKVKVKKVENS